MSLNVIGLISGGKDSLYSLAHCIQHGHKVVALANLYPHVQADKNGANEGPDVNSFMYQTVGHTVIPLYAEAIGVPLYRRRISGSTHQTDKDYDSSTATTFLDETEDMYLLIQDILRHRPEATALNAGAILSTYQRTRVESVAARLGLTPLAYLWQYPALPAPRGRADSLTGLLEDMCASQYDARIIKIASGGVRSNLLAVNVAAPMTGAKLVSGLAPFFADVGQEFSLRGSVLGEGGEYETLALDGSGPLWQKRIKVKFLNSFEAEGGTMYATFRDAVVVNKNETEHAILSVPTLLDKQFLAVQSCLETTSSWTTSKYAKSHTISSVSNTLPSCHLSSSTLQVFNITHPSPDLTAAQQLDHVIDQIRPIFDKQCRSLHLPARSLQLRDIVSTTLLLRSIDDFASINQIYSAKLWPRGLPNPPSRVTIAAPLPEGTHVALSLIVDRNDTHTRCRKGLHVQSRSYWAPANIGPYSQAICTPVLRPQGHSDFSQDHTGIGRTKAPIEVVHMAGQIPLVPASMAMLDRPFSEQAVLALQHLWRVGQERGVDVWASAGVAYLAHLDKRAQEEDEGKTLLDRAHEAARAWVLAHQINQKGARHGSQAEADDTDEEDEDIDIWDMQQRNRGFEASALAKLTVGEHLHVLPKHDLFKALGRGPEGIRSAAHAYNTIPLFVAAELSGLPRNAPIEWWSTGIAGLASHAGMQQCRICPIKVDTGRAASISGFALEHVDQGTAGEDDHGAGIASASDVQSSFDLFITLIVATNLESIEVDILPRTIDDLKRVLVEDGFSMNFEVVTAHSILNLSCSTETRHLLDQIQLVQQAALVPCFHVWTSGQVKAERDVGEVQKENLIQEVAAAVILRIAASS